MYIIEVKLYPQKSESEQPELFCEDDRIEYIAGCYHILKKIYSDKTDFKAVFPTVAEVVTNIKLKISGSKNAVKSIGKMFDNGLKQFYEQGRAVSKSGKSYIIIEKEL